MILVRAPLRLSFFGGGSDFPEVFSRQPGAVLSTAVTWASHVSLRRTPSGLHESPFRLVHEDIEWASVATDIRHPVLRAAFERRRVTGAIELHTFGDIPPASGLGSSSSFSVALLAALDALEGRQRDPKDIAFEAIELERQTSADAVGYQDQMIVALGGLRRLEFRACDDVRVESLELPVARQRDLESRLLLVHLGGRPQASMLERRKLERVEHNRDTLRQMVAQVDRACDLLLSGDLDAFGRLLDDAWVAKRSLAPGVSNPEIDNLYVRCREAGALGGKVLGAGAGGFLLLYTRPEDLETVILAAARPILRPRLGADGVRVLVAPDDSKLQSEEP